MNTLILNCRRQILRYLSVVFILLSFHSHALPPTGTMTVSWPINRSVFQRNSDNKANVFFAGQFFYTSNLECPSLDFYYRVKKLNLETGNYTNTDQVGWTQYWLGNTNTGIFQATIPNLPGGWYDLEVKATSGGVSGTVQATAVIRFGVGDVFVIAGQSNAQSPGVDDGFDSNSYLSTDSWDCVNVHNYNGACKKETDQFPTMVRLINQANPSFRTGPSGFNSWYYSPLGKQIAQNYQIPTAFFNSAIGGTSVLNWSEGAQNLTTVFNDKYLCYYYTGTTQADAIGQPYLTLKNILKYYAKIFGVKAVLWHQGEADTNSGTSAANYQSRLQTVINKSRADFGDSNLTWYVARASYINGVTSANVISGQNSIIGLLGNNVKAGPETDLITGPTRRIPTLKGSVDNTHFWKDGLTDAATAWRNAIYSTPSNLFTAGPPPLANFQMGLPGYPLQADGGYSEYKWNSRANTAPSTQSIASDGRCFVKDANGNWRITPQYIRGSFCGLSGARISADSPQEEIEPGYQFVVSSNPVIDKSSNITFNMPYQGDVRLEIIDLSGRSIKRLANGVHSPGKYAYPVWLTDSPAGTYLCVLQVNGNSMTKRFILAK